jgi:hypothetical protein
MSGSAGPVAYGWPITIIRLSEGPSGQASSSRFDVAGLVVNAFCWAFVAGVCCTPIAIGRYLRTADDRRTAKKTTPRARPAKTFDEHLQDQQPDDGI